MKKYCILFIFALFVSFTSCNNKQKENTKDDNKESSIPQADSRIDSISVLFYNYLIESKTPVKMEDIK